MSLCISFVRVKKGLIFQPETIPLNGKSFNLDFHFKQNINMKVRAEENLTGIICRNVLRIRATAFSTKSNPSLRVEDFLFKMIKKFLFFLQETIVMQTSKVFFLPRKYSDVCMLQITIQQKRVVLPVHGITAVRRFLYSKYSKTNKEEKSRSMYSYVFLTTVA